MIEIIDSILKTCGRELEGESRAKIRHYLETLRSTGTQDSQQLMTYGLGYLEQLHAPDPRYTGC
jgi:hypothetical protein